MSDALFSNYFEDLFHLLKANALDTYAILCECIGSRASEPWRCMSPQIFRHAMIIPSQNLALIIHFQVLFQYSK